MKPFILYKKKKKKKTRSGGGLNRITVLSNYFLLIHRLVVVDYVMGFDLSLRNPSFVINKFSYY